MTFELVPNRTYESTKMGLQRVFYERGACAVMISDQEPSFKAVVKDYSNTEAKETIQWLDGSKSDEREDLERYYGTEFRFHNPESPELMGLVERLHRIIAHSMLSLKQTNLRLSQMTTIIKGLHCMLNKRSLCNMTVCHGGLVGSASALHTEGRRFDSCWWLIATNRVCKLL